MANHFENLDQSSSTNIPVLYRLLVREGGGGLGFAIRLIESITPSRATLA